MDDDDSYRHLWRANLERVFRSDFASIEETYIKPGGNFWVATVKDVSQDDNEKLVGMAALLRASPSEGKVKRVSVDVELHRQGIGRKLMVELERWAKDQGIERLVLDAGVKNKQSIGFYQSLGYELQHESPLPTLFRDPPYYELVTLIKHLDEV